jgi:hypothetical protein
MAYGHAERTLAAIRLLEAETRELLNGVDRLEPEHVRWLRDAADSASVRLQARGPSSGMPPKPRTARADDSPEEALL